MTAESRLRRTFTEADWTLAAWPSTATQLQRAARRRVRILGIATATAIAALTAGIVVPLSMAGGTTARTANGGQHSDHHALPPLGAPGFPATVYPAPGKTPPHGKIPCPSLRGVDQQAPPTQKAAYREFARDFGAQSFGHDLQRTDRSLWTKLQREYTHLSNVVGTVPIGRIRIESVDPLRSSGDGPSAAVDCGSALVKRSNEIVYDAGPDDSTSAYVLQRDGHLLLWGPMPYVAGGGAAPYVHGSKRYVHRHPAKCGNIFTRASVDRSGRTPSITFVARTPKVYFRCALTGWANVALTAVGRSTVVHARHVGSAHQVILRPGQSATATLRVRPCSGPTATYQYADVSVDHIHGVQALVSIRVGHCGAEIGPITKR